VSGDTEDTPRWDDIFRSSPELDEVAAAYYANVEPPEWFYPLVGRVAVETSSLEYHMARCALQLARGTVPTNEQVYCYIGSAKSLDKLLREVKGDTAFAELRDEFYEAKNKRNIIVHSVLWFDEGDGPPFDYWEQYHPKTGRRTILDMKTNRVRMEADFDEIAALCTRAFELSKKLGEETP
jgi:hypothetical protein